MHLFLDPQNISYQTCGKRRSNAETGRIVGTSCFTHSSKVRDHSYKRKEEPGGCLNTRLAFFSQPSADRASRSTWRPSSPWDSSCFLSLSRLRSMNAVSSLELWKEMEWMATGESALLTVSFFLDKNPYRSGIRKQWVSRVGTGAHKLLEPCVFDLV